MLGNMLYINFFLSLTAILLLGQCVKTKKISIKTPPDEESHWEVVMSEKTVLSEVYQFNSLGDKCPLVECGFFGSLQDSSGKLRLVDLVQVDLRDIKSNITNEVKYRIAIHVEPDLNEPIVKIGFLDSNRKVVFKKGFKTEKYNWIKKYNLKLHSEILSELSSEIDISSNDVDYIIVIVDDKPVWICGYLIDAGCCNNH